MGNSDPATVITETYITILTNWRKSMAKSLVEMAAEIIKAQSSATSMSNDDVNSALQSTFQTLSSLQQAEASLAEGEGDAAAKTGVDIAPEKSILKNKIICLECGQEFKMLSPKHLASHGLNGKEYRVKYGFKLRQPLCAKSLSASRKKAGKDRGIPENLKKSIEARSKSKKAAQKAPVKRKTAVKRTRK